MTPMKTFNGYEIVDDKARENIQKLIINEQNYVTKESIFEETIILDCGDAFSLID